MWIVFGTKVNARRIPGGLKVEHTCDQCGEAATFYEKEVTSTFRLYFIDVFDYQRHRVMACGCCGACYATDELGAPGTRAGEQHALPELGARVERVAGQVGEYVERAASAVESGVSSLFSGGRVAPRREAPPMEPSEEDEDAAQARRDRERRVRIRID
jgi:zinc-ribbon family